MKNLTKLNNLFNIVSTEKETEQTGDALLVPAMSKEEELQDDYQLARSTLRRLLVKGENTLDQIIDLAKNSEHPRTYEVAGQLIKTMSDVSKDLLQLQQQLRAIDDTKGKNHISNQTNNVFVGSTDELIRLLKNNESKIIEQ